MSGMAGNVTAFNTVWTYDLYQAYMAPNKSDAHYMWMGRVVTVAGILLSIACAYFARNYNNAMDVIQLVFGFVNAPLFATFLLGMFWSGTTAHRRVLGIAGRDWHVGPGAWPDDGRRERRMAGERSAHVPVDHGPELLAGQLRLYRLLRADLGDFLGHPAHEE